MVHFKQGLKGSIKSMIAGHSFDSYQGMCQQAVKIARVLDETYWVNQAINLGKESLSTTTGD